VELIFINVSGLNIKTGFKWTSIHPSTLTFAPKTKYARYWFKRVLL